MTFGHFHTSCVLSQALFFLLLKFVSKAKDHDLAISYSSDQSSKNNRTQGRIAFMRRHVSFHQFSLNQSS